jgi:hypothetical protein
MRCYITVVYTQAFIIWYYVDNFSVRQGIIIYSGCQFRIDNPLSGYLPV